MFYPLFGTLAHHPLTNRVSLMCQCFLLQYSSVIWMYILLTLIHPSKHSSCRRCVEDVVKTSWRLLQRNIFVFQDVLKTCWRRFLANMSWRRHENILKKASVITVWQVEHFTFVLNDFVSTEQIFADFVTFSMITSSLNCISKIASSSNTTVGSDVVLNYLSFWLESISRQVRMYDFLHSTLSANYE